MEYVHGGRLRRVRARREVVLSAGAIGSPHLLLLSGVGPQQQLRDLRVNCTNTLLLAVRPQHMNRAGNSREISCAPEETTAGHRCFPFATIRFRWWLTCLSESTCRTTSSRTWVCTRCPDLTASRRRNSTHGRSDSSTRSSARVCACKADALVDKRCLTHEMVKFWLSCEIEHTEPSSIPVAVVSLIGCCSHFT